MMRDAVSPIADTRDVSQLLPASLRVDFSLSQIRDVGETSTRLLGSIQWHRSANIAALPLESIMCVEEELIAQPSAHRQHPPRSRVRDHDRYCAAARLDQIILMPRQPLAATHLVSPPGIHRTLPARSTTATPVERLQIADFYLVLRGVFDRFAAPAALP